MKRSWFGFVLLLLTLVVVFVPVPVTKASSSDHVFRVTASRFAYTPSLLRVNPGDRVTIILSTTDVMHGLTIDGYDVDLKAEPGQPTEVSFVADKPGLYRFRCSVICGNMHPFMIGKLQVGADSIFLRAAALSLFALGFVVWKAKS